MMGLMILIVEDNELNRDMLSRRLKRRGFAVSIAIDGQEGLDMARQLAPRLIILDLSIPIIDGWEVAKRLKGNENTAGIPVIALTSHAMVGDREQALAAGCDEYETKPVQFKRLLSKIEALLNPGKGGGHAAPDA